MLFWLGLVAGLIIGWVVEWLIDWRFWRRSLNESLDEESRQRTELEQAQREIQNLQEQLAQLSNSKTASKGTPTANAPDSLERIDGINVIFAQRLQTAGVRTFAQLAQLSPERIVEIIRPKSRQAINPAAWIAQAKQMAQQREGD